jgi:inorganic triphosphatase YgiF
VAIERELKLGAPDGFVMPDLRAALPGVEIHQESTLELDAIYYDTPTLRLIKRGVTLRRRTGEGAPRWTLKLPDDAPPDAELVRREIDVVDADLEVPSNLADHVQPWLGGETLSPVAHVCTTRQRVILRDTRGVAIEVADDLVIATAGVHPPVSFRELEAEVVASGEAGADEVTLLLREVADELQAAGAGSADPTPKLARVLAPLLADG